MMKKQSFVSLSGVEDETISMQLYPSTPLKMTTPKFRMTTALHKTTNIFALLSRFLGIFLILFLLLPTLIYSKTEADVSLMYFDYNGSSFYEFGTYGSARIKQEFGDNVFTFLAGNQRTKGKSGLRSFTHYDFHEVWTDSVYYSNPDTIFVNAFLDTTYTIIDTTFYGIKDIRQNDFFFSYQRKLDKNFALNLKFKYSKVDNSYLNEAVLWGIGSDWNICRINLKTDVSFTNIKYDTLHQIPIFSETVSQDTTYEDIPYDFEPDSLVTTSNIRWDSFSEQTSEEKMRTVQLYNYLTYVYDRVLVSAEFAVYKILDSEIYNENPRLYFGMNAAYYWDNFSLYGGFSQGDKNLLNTFGGTYLNVSSDDFVRSGNLGIVVYPYFREWSVSYEFSRSELTEENTDFSINSHLLNLYYKW